MNVRQLLAVATAATLLVPGTAFAGKGNGKPSGKPESTSSFSIRTLEGPESSPEVTPVPTTETPEVVEAPGAAPAKTRGKSAQAKANARAKKAAKRACKGLSKKKVKGKKGTPYSRCIVAAAQRRKQPVVEAPVEPAPVVEPAPTTETPAEQPAAPVIEEPAPAQPTDPAL